MNDSELRRRELLKQTRRLYQDSAAIPAVHPRYGRYQQHTDRQRDSERNSRKWNGFYQSDQTLLKLWIH